MARDTSRALGGFWPLPPEVTHSIAALIRRGPGDHYSVFDPCAADGTALIAISRAVFGDVWSRLHVYGVELEQSRAAKLLALGKGKQPVVDSSRLHVLSGDAFAVEWSFTRIHAGDEHNGASLLYANPPYDEGKLERRFLDRFTGALRPGGVLVWVVPHHSLARAADIFGRHYNVVGCYRFPEPLFSQDKARAFKQIVLYAVKRTPLLDPDPKVVARVNQWSVDASTILVLPEAGTARPIVTAQGHPYHRSGFAEWRMRPSDTEGLMALFRPFTASTKQGGFRDVPGMTFPRVADLLCRSYPVATPLKPAHIATAIAAGVFNGALITADDPSQGWPDLLVKGVFDREFVEVDEKVNKDGEKTASVRVQQPRLRVTVLDLRAGTYHTLVDSDQESDATTVSGLTTADLLAVYGQALLRVMLANCPALHDPLRDGDDVQIADVARPLYQAQAHTVRALLKLLGADKPVVVPQRARYRRRKTIAPGILAEAVRRHYRGKAAVLLGQVGSGKSQVALSTMKTIAQPVIDRGGVWRTLVLVPPHLLKSWRDQAAFVTPEARVVYLNGIVDVDALAQDQRPGMVVCVLSREIGKLGHSWDGVQYTRVMLRSDTRVGFGETAARRARKAIHATLRATWIDDDAEVWVGLEKSQDGATWEPAGAFQEVAMPGDYEVSCSTADARFVRVIWSATGAASFGVVDHEPTEGTCPRCGVETPTPDKQSANHRDELARKRVRCPRKHRTPANDLARAALIVAETMHGAFPHSPSIRELLTSRAARRAVEAAAVKVADLFVTDDVVHHTTEADKQQHLQRVSEGQRRAARAARDPRLHTATRLVAGHLARAKWDGAIKYVGGPLSSILWGIADDNLTAEIAVMLYQQSAKLGVDTWGAGANLRAYARELLHALPAKSPAQEAAVAAMVATGVNDKATGYYAGYVAPWDRWHQDREAIQRGTRADNNGVTVKHGSMTWNGRRRGDPVEIVTGLGALSVAAAWHNDGEKAEPCGEPLYEACADPQRGGRRYALSRYIVRRHRRLFDMMIADEDHENSSDTSAQGRSAYRLMGLGMPVIAMTGTAMGGYAEQLFNRQIALDPRFRDEFGRNQRGDFIDRYGYVKVQERDIDKRTGEVVAYGTTSDRVERETRILGNAPGVLPLFLLRYLLRISAVLHKADLALELPPCREIPVAIDPGPELTKIANKMLEDLKQQISRDRFDRFLAGKLFGALAHFATDYPLLASEEATNGKGAYEVRYPRNPELGVHAGELVTSAPAFPRDVLLPIEQWTIDLCRGELAEGRRVICMATSTVFLPRLRRLLEEALGEPVVYLDAKKVPTEKREDWINQHIIDAGVRVMVVNPVAIQTGLNPLVHFATELWLQNPGCNCLTYRQAIGRVDRIGQRAHETRIYFATYDLPAAQAAYSLLMHKVGVSLATDGLDAGGALAAAGVGGENGERIDGYSVGKLIHEVMTGQRKFRSRKHADAAEPVRYRAGDGGATAMATSRKATAARRKRAKVGDDASTTETP